MDAGARRAPAAPPPSWVCAEPLLKVWERHTPPFETPKARQRRVPVKAPRANPPASAFWSARAMRARAATASGPRSTAADESGAHAAAAAAAAAGERDDDDDEARACWRGEESLKVYTASLDFFTASNARIRVHSHVFLTVRQQGPRRRRRRRPQTWVWSESHTAIGNDSASSRERHTASLAKCVRGGSLGRDSSGL